MKGLIFFTALLVISVFCVTPAAFAVPAIIGEPMIDSPPLLNWGRDVDNGLPDLTEETANRLADLHGSFSDCDIVLTTAGNYHMALRDLWYDLYLPKYAAITDLKNWFYTTSPPIALQQIQNSSVVFGNLALKCIPQVAVGPRKVINSLIAAGMTEGDAVPVFRNQGNVLLVKKGNPKNIQSIWDLGRPDVKVVTPNPDTEPGSFGNYSGSIYNIAFNDQANAPAGWTAERLFNVIFNGSSGNGSVNSVGKRHKSNKNKWYAGARIHHRETPWSIAYGNADVGVIFYHLARNAVTRFPDIFEMIPLGGTIENPQPLPGNQIGAHFTIRIKGAWTQKQLEAREYLIDTFASPEFTTILLKHGLQR